MRRSPCARCAARGHTERQCGHWDQAVGDLVPPTGSKRSAFRACTRPEGGCAHRQIRHAAARFEVGARGCTSACVMLTSRRAVVEAGNAPSHSCAPAARRPREDWRTVGEMRMAGRGKEKIAQHAAGGASKFGPSEQRITPKGSCFVQRAHELQGAAAARNRRDAGRFHVAQRRRVSICSPREHVVCAV